jgi:hypothetical protein
VSTRNFLEKFHQNESFGKTFIERRKKGQLQIGITMLILLVFIILLVLSIVIYFRFTYEEIEETKGILLDQKYNSLLSVIIGLPEFRCSRLGAESECLDASKLSDFLSVSGNNEQYYRDLFGDVTGIWVDVLDPGIDLDGDGFVENDYSSDDKFEIYGGKNSGKIYAVPVSVYYPDYKKYKIGILRIQGDVQ